MPYLRISYINRYGAARFLEYDTISEFVKTFESKIFDVDSKSVQAVFMNKQIDIKMYDTLQDLYDYCKKIM